MQRGSTLGAFEKICRWFLLNSDLLAIPALLEQLLLGWLLKEARVHRHRRLSTHNITRFCLAQLLRAHVDIGGDLSGEATRGNHLSKGKIRRRF